jgi:hypothetical protein
VRTGLQRSIMEAIYLLCDSVFEICYFVVTTSAGVPLPLYRRLERNHFQKCGITFGIQENVQYSESYFYWIYFLFFFALKFRYFYSLFRSINTAIIPSNYFVKHYSRLLKLCKTRQPTTYINFCITDTFIV